MKKVVVAMLTMFLLIVWPLGGLWSMIFEKIIGGGISESFLYPIYGGIILLAGLIVGCAVIICDKLDNIGVARGKDQEL